MTGGEAYHGLKAFQGKPDMSKSEFLTEDLNGRWSIFKARLQNKKEVALITLLRISRTHATAMAVHGYDTGIILFSFYHLPSK